MTGAMATLVGIPAALSALTAARRLRGEGARGSNVRESGAQSDVIDKATEARPSAARGAIMSESRTTRSDFVVIVNGCRVSASTSRIERVIRHLPSIGW